MKGLVYWASFTVLHGRYKLHQPIIRYHLYYSILIPQHPRVPSHRWPMPADYTMVSSDHRPSGLGASVPFASFIWTRCFCSFRHDLPLSYLTNRFRFRCQPYFGHIFVRESVLMLLLQRKRDVIWLCIRDGSRDQRHLLDSCMCYMIHNLPSVRSLQLGPF